MAKTIKKFQSPNKNYVIRFKNDKSIKKDSKGKIKIGSKGKRTKKSSKGKRTKKGKKGQKKKSKVSGKDDYAIYVNSVEIEITNNTFSKDDIDVENIAKYKGNNKMSVMDKLETGVVV